MGKINRVTTHNLRKINVGELQPPAITKPSIINGRSYIEIISVSIKMRKILVAGSAFLEGCSQLNRLLLVL